MPHVTVKMYAGRSEAQKTELATAVADDVARITGCDLASVSVAVEEFDPAEWPESVYRPEILGRKDDLVIAPGYNPFE